MNVTNTHSSNTLRNVQKWSCFNSQLQLSDVNVLQYKNKFDLTWLELQVFLITLKFLLSRNKPNINNPTRVWLIMKFWDIIYIYFSKHIEYGLHWTYQIYFLHCVLAAQRHRGCIRTAAQYGGSLWERASPRMKLLMSSPSPNLGCGRQNACVCVCDPLHYMETQGELTQTHTITTHSGD